MFARQCSLSNFGETSQALLRNASVMVVGCGGLGCIAALELACSGIGSLHLIDFDVIDRSNLHRQIVYTQDDIGFPKAQVLARECRKRNPDCVVSYEIKGFCPPLKSAFDMILDCTDNASVRLLINRVAREQQIPYIFGSAIGWDGQLFTVRPDGPCIECIFPQLAEVTDRCSNVGVLSTVPIIIGTLQATEAIRWITKKSVTHSRLLLYSAYTETFEYIDFDGVPNCTHFCATSASGAEAEISYDQMLSVFNSSKDVLIDLRATDEIMHAISIHFEAAEAYIDANVADKTTNIYVICEMGDKSLAVVTRLRNKGYTSAWSVLL